MALNERLTARFWGLLAGLGQPDERDFAAALLELDAALNAVELRLGNSKRPAKVPMGATDTQSP